MTAAELGSRFDLELDALASGVAPGFLNTEKSQLLTKAQDELIQAFVQARDYKSIYTIVEQKRIASLSADSNYTGKTYYIALGSEIPDFRYFISARVQVNRSTPSLTGSKVNCELIGRGEMYRFLETGFNKPYFKYPKVVLEQNESTDLSRLYVVLDYYTTSPSNLEVSYVRKPANISIDGSITSELPEFLHKEIVSLAVQEAVKSLYISKIPQGKEQ